MRFFIIGLTLLSIFSVPVARAEQRSTPLAINPHIRIMPYSKDEVHRYTGFYDYASCIVIEPGEEVKSLAIGDPSAWKVDIVGNRIFIKPIQQDASTNAILTTDRRDYHLSLHASEATGPDDKNLAIETRFVYPESGFNAGINGGIDSSLPDLTDPGRLNFQYATMGNDNIKPVKVYDDGKFTYLEFSPYNVNLPAVFKVDSDGTEALVNVRTIRDSQGLKRVLVVEQLAPLLTLRYGEDYVCVKNGRMPYIYKKPRKRK